MQHEVVFFSPHFIDDTLNTRAECVRDSLICRKYMFLAKIFALWSMGIQLVPSPHLTLPVITWYPIFTIRPKCQQRIAIFAECKVSLSRFLLMHRLFCWSDRHILCGNLIEFDGKNVYILGPFVFIITSMFNSEKNMGCLAHQKYVCYIFIIYSQCRQDSEVQDRMIFRDRDAFVVNSVTETPGAF